MLNKAKLDSVLEEITTRWGIPGLGVGIVYGNETIYTKALGVQSLETRVPVTVDSIFCVASISKCFVACAVMQLVEGGLIELDAPLVKTLPYFKLDDERSQQITIRQVLSHTSGMPDIDELEYTQWISHPETDEGAAERYVRGLSSLKLIATPGERFQYSNIGYDVLGDLIAKASGQSFEEYMRENILRPAGMADSTFLPAEINQHRLAQPHLRTPQMIVSPTYPYHRADAPSSSLHSTVADMCQWGSTCLNRGMFKGQRSLTPASYELMWTPAAKRRSMPLYEDYGLGWNLGHYEGEKTVSHGGAGFGWTCFFVLLPEKQMAAVILCNEESSARSRTIRAVLRSMLDLEPEAGSVSWMVPVTEALQAGGLQAAIARYDELKRSGSEGFFFDPDELINLVTQLMNVHKIDLAIEVLKLNLHAFPVDAGTYTRLAELYTKKGELALAEECLRKRLEIKAG